MSVRVDFSRGGMVCRWCACLCAGARNSGVVLVFVLVLVMVFGLVAVVVFGVGGAGLAVVVVVGVAEEGALTELAASVDGRECRAGRVVEAVEYCGAGCEVYGDHDDDGGGGGGIGEL
jgi:hypothetical protein